MKKRTIYIRREKTIETVGNYRIIKTIVKGRKALFRATGQVGEWTWSTPLYGTYEQCRQAVNERIRCDALSNPRIEIKSALEVSKDMFPIESELEKGEYHVYS